MKAACYEKQGHAAEVLQVAEVTTPEPEPGEVRVRLHTSGVNPSDVKSRGLNAVRPMPGPRVIPHSDGAGIVDAVGRDVPLSCIGERVWIWKAARPSVMPSSIPFDWNIDWPAQPALSLARQILPAQRGFSLFASPGELMYRREKLRIPRRSQTGPKNELCQSARFQLQ